MKYRMHYSAQGDEYISRVGLSGHYEGTNHHGVNVVLESTKVLEAGETVDLTADIQPNYDYFQTGTGYGGWDNVDRDGSEK